MNPSPPSLRDSVLQLLQLQACAGSPTKPSGMPTDQTPSLPGNFSGQTQLRARRSNPQRGAPRPLRRHHRRQDCRPIGPCTAERSAQVHRAATRPPQVPESHYAAVLPQSLDTVRRTASASATPPRPAAVPESAINRVHCAATSPPKPCPRPARHRRQYEPQPSAGRPAVPRRQCQPPRHTAATRKLKAEHIVPHRTEPHSQRACCLLRPACSLLRSTRYLRRPAASPSRPAYSRLRTGVPSLSRPPVDASLLSRPARSLPRSAYSLLRRPAHPAKPAMP